MRIFQKGVPSRKISLRWQHFACFFSRKAFLPSNNTKFSKSFVLCHFCSDVVGENPSPPLFRDGEFPKPVAVSFDFPGSTLSTSLFGGNGLPDFFTVFFHICKRVEKLSCKMGGPLAIL